MSLKNLSWGNQNMIMRTESEKPKIQPFSKQQNIGGLKSFNCGDPVINKYVQDNLRKDGNRDNKNLFLLLANHKLMGFVSSHLFLLRRQVVPNETFTYSLPPQIAVVKISMIAVDNDYQTNGWGTQLLKFALEHAYQLSKISKDIKGVFLDAKESLVGFYAKYGFVELPDDASAIEGTKPMFLPIDRIRKIYEKNQKNTDS